MIGGWASPRDWGVKQGVYNPLTVAVYSAVVARLGSKIYGKSWEYKPATPRSDAISRYGIW